MKFEPEDDLVGLFIFVFARDDIRSKLPTMVYRGEKVEDIVVSGSQGIGRYLRMEGWKFGARVEIFANYKIALWNILILEIGEISKIPVITVLVSDRRIT